jgi:probable HAF family extracellular repeat protein
MKTRWLRNCLISFVAGLVIALGFSIFTPASATSRFYYSVTDLGSLDDGYIFDEDINDFGQVVGRLRNNSGKYHAALWVNGRIKDLGTLGGESSSAYGINNNRQVVGCADTSSGESHAFVWEKGTMKDLGTLGGKSSCAYKINNIGQVVGQSSLSSGQGYHAFLWENGTMKDLGTLGGNSKSQDINDAGQVVGYSDSSGTGWMRAFLWENGTMKALDVPSVNDYESVATAINNRGQIVGYVGSDIIFKSRAVLWENGTVKELGTLYARYSSASDINNRGQAVGSLDFPPLERTFHASNLGYLDGTSHPFLWQNGKTRNIFRAIPDLAGWKYIGASDINNRGQILGSGRVNGQNRRFLLTPTWVTQ